jgi:membrane dipeptidase
MDVFDGHNDSVHKIREYREGGIDYLERGSVGHVDLVRAREGGFAGGFFAMWVAPTETPKDNVTITENGYAVRMAETLDPAYALGETRRQLAALRALVARSDDAMRIATSVDEIELARYDKALAMVLHIEGAEAIGPELRELEEFYAAGLRGLGIVWSRPNIFGAGVPFACPSSPDTGPGLTPVGMDLVRECNRLGMMIDLAHLNERGFWDVAKLSTAPLVATHTCVHAICPSARNLTDKQLDAIADSDGLVGVNLSVSDIWPDGRKDAEVPLELLARHYVYLAERIGVDRVAIGSDFDGATVPAAIGGADGLPRLIEALRGAGFDEASLRKITFENWMRVLRLIWK